MPPSILDTAMNFVGSDYDNITVDSETINAAGANGIFIRDVQNLTISNCTISNANNGISAEDVVNLTITGCTISGCAANGISLNGGQSANSRVNGANGVLIDNCDISNCDGNGILLRQKSQEFLDDIGDTTTIAFDLAGVIVRGNTLYDIGVASSDQVMYVQCSDPVIIDNIIEGTNTGAGISMRSSGIVEGNNISGCDEGLEYWGNHKIGPRGVLVFRNNTVTAGTYAVKVALPAESKDQAHSYIDDLWLIDNTINAGSIFQDAGSLAQVSMHNAHAARLFPQNGDVPYVAILTDVNKNVIGFEYICSGGNWRVQITDDGLVNEVDDISSVDYKTIGKKIPMGLTGGSIIRVTLNRGQL